MTDPVTQTIVLESDALRVVIDPACGGKIRSFRSRATGAEYFFQDRRPAFDVARGYSYHDISGYDECFPSVAPCKAPDGRAYADHGSLWQQPWRVTREEGAVNLTAEIETPPCSVRRRCMLETSTTLRLEYDIHNRGDKAVPFVYSAHPILAGDGDARLILPDGLEKVYVAVAADNFGLAHPAWAAWPPPQAGDITGPFDAGRETFVKLFCGPLREGRAAVWRADLDEGVVFTFANATLPYLGVLTSLGHDSLGDGAFHGKIFLALEPTSGMGDDLDTCAATGTSRELAAGAHLRFWIRLSLTTNPTG